MARLLTDSEIEYIIDFIVPARHLPPETAMSIARKNREKIVKMIKGIKLVPEGIDEFKSAIQSQYFTSQIQPGESVGILTAQSIGERQTQSTLNTFHSTGLSVKTVITGVPRFTELLNTTKEPKAKTCTIYYKGKHPDIQSLRDKVGNSLRHLTLKKIKKRTSFTCEKRQDWWYEDFDMFYGDLYNEYKYSIRFEMDMDKVFEYQVKIEDIATIIQDHFDDIKCAFAPEQEGVLDVYIDTSHISIDDTIFESVEEAIESYIEDTVIPEVESHRLYGIEGIDDIFFEKKGEEWVVETEGSNLSKVFALSNIDFARTLCNNMWEIYHTLGIEATRNFLLEEFDNVVSSDGNFVHQSHTMLLVDIMTFQGTLTSINRYGLKNEQCGPLSKASFEESLDNFLKAAAFGEKENTKSVSASIMLGKTGRFGTGICDLIVNIGQNPGMPQTIREDVVEKTPRKVF